ncbi:MAG: RDD family protein [Deltaproteobacteria bacterium]|nr:RDD family protein [Deltaproteobacteria bacterium]
MSYAGFWKRLAAVFIDGLILSLLLVIPVEILEATYGIFVAGIASGLINYVYFALFESSSRQATLGKMALEIKVTDIYGSRIKFGRAILRNFGKIISILTLFIGYIMAAFTKKKQALHDMMAGCLVVNVNDNQVNKRKCEALGRLPKNDTKQDLILNTHNVGVRQKTSQLRKETVPDPVGERKASTKEMVILEDLKNEGVLTPDEFTEKMAIVEANEEARRFDELLRSITEPLIVKISNLEKVGLLDTQESVEKKRAIIEKHRAELTAILHDNYRAINSEVFDYLDIVDKKTKLGIIKTEDQKMDEIFKWQEIEQELIGRNEICPKCYAFRKPSDEKCSACGQVFNDDWVYT